MDAPKAFLEEMELFRKKKFSVPNCPICEIRPLSIIFGGLYCCHFCLKQKTNQNLSKPPNQVKILKMYKKKISSNIICFCRKKIHINEFFFHISESQKCRKNFLFKCIKFPFLNSPNKINFQLLELLKSHEHFCIQIHGNLLQENINLILKFNPDFKICICGINYQTCLKQYSHFELILIDFHNRIFETYEKILNNKFIVFYLIN